VDLPKAEATELAPEAVGASPPEHLDLRGGLSCAGRVLRLVKLPSGGFGHKKLAFS